MVKNQTENSSQQREQALTLLSNTVTTVHTPLLDSKGYSMYSSAKHFFLKHCLCFYRTKVVTEKIHSHSFKIHTYIQLDFEIHRHDSRRYLLVLLEIIMLQLKLLHLKKQKLGIACVTPLTW